MRNTTRKKEHSKIARLIERNNKARKGLYIGIQEPGHPYREYKITPTMTPHLAYEYYKKKYLIKDATLAPRFNTYQKQISQQKSLTRQIRKGITQTIITDALNTPPTDAHKITKKLLQKLVKDDDLLNIISKDENMQKIQTRLTYNIDLMDKDGKTKIAHITSFGQKTVMKTLIELHDILRVGEEIKGHSPTIKMKLEEKGYNYQHLHDGQLKNVQITVKFIKGK